ncbi:MAG: hypothetical protein QOK48_2792 [Blastocatellia bacterium]|jgi:hypothetical protein|nr:hypothetical protein [Blastocatellia bacterium]
MKPCNQFSNFEVPPQLCFDGQGGTQGGDPGGGKAGGGKRPGKKKASGKKKVRR